MINIEKKTKGTKNYHHHQQMLLFSVCFSHWRHTTILIVPGPRRNEQKIWFKLFGLVYMKNENGIIVCWVIWIYIRWTWFIWSGTQKNLWQSDSIPPWIYENYKVHTTIFKYFSSISIHTNTFNGILLLLIVLLWKYFFRTNLHSKINLRKIFIWYK